MRPLNRLRIDLGRFARDGEGVAAVEFALIAPLLLLLYLGSLEASDLYAVDKRVNTVSAAVGDLISQWDPDDGKLPTATLNSYLGAATTMMMPYDSAGMSIVVSLVQVKSDGTTKVLWSTANASGTARTVNSSFTPLTASSQMNQVARGGCIVAAETSFSYTPVLGLVFTNALTLAHNNYFLPRYGREEPINLQTTSVLDTACTT